MEPNVEQKIANYESNIIKQAFFDRDVFIHLKDKIPEGFFNNQVREVIWRTFLFIDDAGELLSRSSVEDVFETSDNKDHIDKVWEILEAEYPDESHWKYQYRYLFEVYSKTNIIKVCEEAKKKMPKSSSVKIIDYMIENLSKYDSREEASYSMDESVIRAKQDIALRKEGKINPYIKTGSPKFDKLIKLDFNQIVLFAAARKIGKTKFTINMIMEMLTIDPSIHVKFHSFELSEKELMYEIISRETNLTAEQIQSKDYVLSEQEMQLIDEAFERIKDLNIDISTTPVPIKQVYKDFVKFCRVKNSERCILIIDNMGLLKDKGRSQTEVDDYIASTLVDIRDATKGLIIPIHHMTKDVDKPDRLIKGYRPTLGDLKGSTRIQDYANKVVLLHRPGFFEDLVEREEKKGMIKLSEGNFQRGKIIRRLFVVDLALNRGGQKGVVRFLHKIQYCQFKEWK